MTVRGHEYYANRAGKVYLLIAPNTGYTSATTEQADFGSCRLILDGIRFYWLQSLRYF